MSRAPLEPVTFAIEWDNAGDAAPGWVARHLDALQAELLRHRWRAKPTLLYLYDSDSLDELEIRAQIAAHGAKLTDCAELRVVPVPGGDYLALKSAGVGMAATELVVSVDCDVAAQPGWLEQLLAPFSDEDVVAVAGFTSIEIDGLLSKVCALGWVYHLASEADLPVTKNAIHANNFAVRAAYYRAHPWRAPAGGKKGGTHFLREIERQGKRWVRASGARMLHPPHRSPWSFVRRGWAAGLDQDWVNRQQGDSSRRARVRQALHRYRTNTRRAVSRVITQRREVSLPLRQMPAALCLAFAHWTATLAGELVCAVRR